MNSPALIDTEFFTSSGESKTPSTSLPDDRDDDGNFRVIQIRYFTLGLNVAYAPFKDGAEVAQFTLKTTEPEIDITKVETNCDFTFIVTFGQDIGITPAHGVMGVLGNILLHIREDVVPPFIDYFEITA